jgi:2-keto-3-deoxy-L-rhamnonate aldolase RhmA
MIGSQSPNPFLRRISDGDLTLMLVIRSHRTAEVVRLAAATGHHAVMVDLEHSTMSTDQAAQMCAVAADLGLTPLVRVPEREYGDVARLLDGGAHGIIFPRIETANEATTASRACRFAPRGQRSAVSSVPQLGMRPTKAADLARALDDLTIVQMLIETPEAVANADAIAAVDGVDSLCIGANDLTLELGIPGAYSDPRFLEAVAAVTEACRRHSKPLQIGGVADLEIIASLVRAGASALMITGTDTDLLFSAAGRRVSELSEWYGEVQRGTVGDPK